MTSTDLRVFRASRKLKQSDVAAMLGISRQWVSVLENHYQELPEKIAKRLEAIQKAHNKESR